MSGRLTPAASTRTRISPSRGTGRGSSTRCSASAGPLPPRIAIALIVLPIRASYGENPWPFADGGSLSLDASPDRDYYHRRGQFCTQAVPRAPARPRRAGTAGILQHHPAVGADGRTGAGAAGQPRPLHVLPLEA